MKVFTLNKIKSLIDKSMKEEPINSFLDSRYDEVTSIISHSNVYYKLFYHIAKELKPNVVVELGGWRGYGAAHFAAGNPDSLVISIDHHSDPGDNVNQTKMIECCQEYKNMRYVQGWTTPEYIRETNKGVNGLQRVKEILGKKKIDLLYIDSWHEDKYFLRDWNTYKEFLAPLSLVIADDLMNTELFKNMEEVWESMPGEKFVDARPHHGIPMGFSKIDNRKTNAKTNRKSNQPKTTKISN